MKSIVETVILSRENKVSKKGNSYVACTFLDGTEVVRGILAAELENVNVELCKPCILTCNATFGKYPKVEVLGIEY